MTTWKTRPAKLPGIPPTSSADPSMRAWMQAVSERLEVREGSRGNADERVVTQRDLREQTNSLSSSSWLDQYKSIDDLARGMKTTPTYTDLLKRIDGGTTLGSSSTPSITGGSTTVVSSSGGQYLSVKDEAFGAVGDGVTDDSAAIQKCIDAAKADQKTVFFPDGVYLVSTLAEQSGRVLLLGTGNSLIKGEFKYRETAFPVAANTNTPITPTAPYFAAENLMFEATGSAYALRLATVQQTEFLSTFNLVNCKFFGSRGLLLQHMIGFELTNCEFNNRVVGVRAEACVNGLFTACRFQNQAEAGVFITGHATEGNRAGGENMRFVNCEWAVCTYGVIANEHLWLTLDSCLLDYCDTPLFLSGANWAKAVNTYFGASNVASSRFSGVSGYLAPGPSGTAVFGRPSGTPVGNRVVGFTAHNCEFINYRSGASQPIVYIDGYVSSSFTRSADEVAFYDCLFYATAPHSAPNLLEISNVSVARVIGNRFRSFNLSTTMANAYRTNACVDWQNHSNSFLLCQQNNNLVRSAFERGVGVEITATEPSSPYPGLFWAKPKTGDKFELAVRDNTNTKWLTMDAAASTTLSYSVMVNQTTVEEGTEIVYTVGVGNSWNGTLYWTNAGTTTAADFTDGVNSGSVVVTNGVGTIRRTLVNDMVSETGDTILIQLRSDSTSGTVLTQANQTVTVVDAAMAYSVMASASVINEGQTVTYTVGVSGAWNGTLYWTNAGTTTAADFTDGVNSGAVTIVNGVGSISRTLVNDSLTEGGETILIQLRSGSTGGPILTQANTTVTVNDTSAAVSYSVMVYQSTVNEGEAVTYTVGVGGSWTGTLYWTNAGTTTAADFTDGVNSGSVAVTNGVGTITRTLVNDGVVESGDTILIQLRSGSTSGTVLTQANQTVTVVDATTSYSVIADRTTLTEGQTVTYTVGVSGAWNGTLYWTNAGTTTAADFTDGVNSGAVTISGGVGYIARTLVNDGLTETSDTILIQLRSGSTGGPILTQANVTVNVTDVTMSYSVMTSQTTVMKGQTISYTVGVSGSWNGTLFWDDVGSCVTSDFVDNTKSGSVTITNGVGYITRQLAAYGSPDVDKTVLVRLKDGAGTVITQANRTVDVAGSFAVMVGTTAANPVVQEGQIIPYTVSVSKSWTGTLYWVHVGTASAADFTDGQTSGSVSITSGVGNIYIPIATDSVTDVNETVLLQLRAVSTTGPLITQADKTVTIADVASSGGSGGSGATLPATLQLTRNNLNFAYAPYTVSSNSNWVEVIVTLDTTNFFNSAVGGSDHIGIALDARGSCHTFAPDGTRKHCGPIVRSGADLWDEARGIILFRNGQMYFEQWLLGSPGTTGGLALQSMGYGFDPTASVNRVFTIRLWGGYRSGTYANRLEYDIFRGSSTSGALLTGGSTSWGWDAQGSHKLAIFGIADGFVPPSSTGCVETTAAGSAASATLGISNFQVRVY